MKFLWSVLTYDTNLIVIIALSVVLGLILGWLIMYNPPRKATNPLMNMWNRERGPFKQSKYHAAGESRSWGGVNKREKLTSEPY